MINNRYEFVMLFDVENGNPNGDPDYGNAPRIDHETGYGFVTDVCLKRKIRNYVQLRSCLEPETYPLAETGDKLGYDILIKPDRLLNDVFGKAHAAVGGEEGKKKKKDADDVAAARNYMCRNYFDVRTFGAVMSTGDNPCGIVRGPVQIAFAQSVSPVFVNELTITRQAKTSESRGEKAGTTEMGRKSVIPYALYRADGYISAALTKDTGMNDEDLALLWDAIIHMFEDDHSAARGKMSMRKLILFRHKSILGNCLSNRLFEKIEVTKNSPDAPARAYSDYTVALDREMPDGVELIEML